MTDGSPSVKSPLVVFAAVAHPDDIEFCFSGTLLLLQAAGCKIHMWNLANGCCGTMIHSREEIARIRLEEARASAALAGAEFHEPLFNDLEIFYDKPSLAAVSAVLRSVAPDIVLTHAPQDYMEDHQNVCRLITTAAFSRGIKNFSTQPQVAPCSNSTRIYHAAPHGLKDGLETPFSPSHMVDVTSVMEMKEKMLTAHHSQRAWLEETQGLGAFVEEMKSMCGEMGRRTGQMEFAEGWRRHSHLGFCAQEFDPLHNLLENFCRRIDS